MHTLQAQSYTGERYKIPESKEETKVEEDIPQDPHHVVLPPRKSWWEECEDSVWKLVYT